MEAKELGDGKGALSQATSWGGLVVNSYVGRSQRTVTPQAHNFSCDRLTSALSRPPRPVFLGIKVHTLLKSAGATLTGEHGFC